MIRGSGVDAATVEDNGPPSLASGRLLDLMGQGIVDLSAIDITVVDEADHIADMGFLPGVRRIVKATPERGQRMLFSATLDAGVATLASEFLHDPVKHEADSELSPVGTMKHHVLRIAPDQRTNVLAQLSAAPGNTIILTRTKHGAKKLAKQLIGMGIAAVDLHGNLSQNARTRNMEAFHGGRVSTLVATDIAARGIHVDDVALVIHADPPAEHKTYLHRSGRTDRAGASGTVVTLETPAQRGEVRTLLRQAKISATFNEATSSSSILAELAPGERVFLAADEAAERSGMHRPQQQPSRPSGGGRQRNGRDQGRPQQEQPASAGRGSRTRGRRGGRSSAPQTASSAPKRSVADFSRSQRSR
ncbi:DEAD/DEAH box helicase [uncultured Tessaracoccus sp.]|uniref:DEAD/DEAH box helicase n=1 Tax=uncultured Tessaracoccus sp. TaxID=905023 RepID=UPI00261C832C|nr:DEAD/DEAH box helicase [uncultured Tessaracoccus sp.]